MFRIGFFELNNYVKKAKTPTNIIMSTFLKNLNWLECKGQLKILCVFKNLYQIPTMVEDKRNIEFLEFRNNIKVLCQ